MGTSELLWMTVLSLEHDMPFAALEHDMPFAAV